MLNTTWCARRNCAQWERDEKLALLPVPGKHIGNDKHRGDLSALLWPIVRRVSCQRDRRQSLLAHQPRAAQRPAQRGRLFDGSYDVEKGLISSFWVHVRDGK